MVRQAKAAYHAYKVQLSIPVMMGAAHECISMDEFRMWLTIYKSWMPLLTKTIHRP